MDEFVVKMHFRQVPLKIISYINLKKKTMIEQIRSENNLK